MKCPKCGEEMTVIREDTSHDFDKKKKFSNDRLRTIELQTRLGNDIEYQDNVTKLDGVQRGMDTLRIYTEELKRTVELNLWVLKTQS